MGKKKRKKKEEESEPTLPNVIVDDYVPGSPYRSVEMQVYELGIKAVDDATGEESVYEVKLFIPYKVNERFDFYENLVYRLEKMLERTTGFEAEFYAYIILTLEFYVNCPKGFFVFERTFELATFGKKPAFLELAEYLEKKAQPHVEVLKEAGKTDAGFGELMDYAIYKKPPVANLFSERSYAAFRKRLVEELAFLNLEIVNTGKETIEDIKQEIINDKEMDEREREKRLKAIERFKADDEEIGEIKGRIIRNIIVDTVHKDKDSAKKTEKFADKAFKMILKIAKGMDFSRPEDEINADIESRFNLIEYNELLGDLIVWYEKEYKIPPIQKDGITDEKFQEMLFDAESSSELDPTMFQYLALIESMRTDNLFQKLRMLVWISDNFTNRLAFLERMYHDASEIYHAVLSWGYRKVYEKIRHIMSREEKRAYKLMFFPQPYFGNLIAFAERRINDFFTGMDDDTRLLLMAGLIHNKKSVAGFEDAVAELEKRWKAYLRVYPAWALTVQDEERIKGAAKRDRVISLSKIVGAYGRGGKGAKEITLGEKLPGPAEWEPEHVIDLLANQPEYPDLHKWVADYCTKQQRQVIKMMFLTGNFIGLNQCAEILEIAPSTIRNHFKGGILNIRECLVHDKIFPPERFKPLLRMDFR